MKCVSCLQGTPWECRHKGECDGLHNDLPAISDGSIASVVADFNENVGSGLENSTESVDSSDGHDPTEEPQIRTYKDDSSLRDQQSTGRKRAAKAYPLNAEAACEWRMQSNCGGGEHPIVGCHAGLQQARHHGPDKQTLNNDLGNVHRICHQCHNRWHTLNDDGYIWGHLYNPHDPSECSLEEIALNEVFWDGRKVRHAKD